MDSAFSNFSLAFTQDPFEKASAPPSLSPTPSINQTQAPPPPSHHPTRQSSLRPVSRPPHLQHHLPSSSHTSTQPPVSSSFPTSYNPQHPQHPSHHTYPPFSQTSTHETPSQQSVTHPSSSYSASLPPPLPPLSSRVQSLGYPTPTTQYNHNTRPQQPSVPCSSSSVPSTSMPMRHPPPPHNYYNSPPTMPHATQNPHNQYVAHNSHMVNSHMQMPTYSNALSSNQMHIPVSAPIPNNVNNNYSRPLPPPHMNMPPQPHIPQHHYNSSFSSSIPVTSTSSMTNTPCSMMQQHHQPPKPAPPGYPSMSTGMPSSSTIPAQISSMNTSTTSSPSSVASLPNQRPPGYPAMGNLPPSMDSAGVGENHDTWSAPGGSGAGGISSNQVDTMDPNMSYPGKKNRWWRRKSNNLSDRQVSDGDDSN